MTKNRHLKIKAVIVNGNKTVLEFYTDFMFARFDVFLAISVEVNKCLVSPNDVQINRQRLGSIRYLLSHVSDIQPLCAILCHLWPLWLHHICRHYLIKSTIFEEKLLNVKCVLNFSTALV
jgi:hypothetical protein